MRNEIHIGLFALYYTTQMIIKNRYRFQGRHCLQFIITAYYIHYYEKIKIFNRDMLYHLLKPIIKPKEINRMSISIKELCERGYFENAGIHGYYRMTLKGKRVFNDFMNEIDVLSIRNREHLDKQEKVIAKKLNK